MSDIVGPPGRGGRLKVFLGMSAGVGKTFTMLKEAKALQQSGARVLVAWLEPHGRVETDEQAVGLSRLAPRVVDYRGIAVREMDLDAVLAAAPELVLVDELAHSNTPGMKHPKRWQDVMDILDAGIDVFTTVNIQHLESVADSVEEMSSSPVRERVPDAVFDRADNIQVIDISPEDLLVRLKAGKVYTGQATREAIENFFRPEKLAALRELALRQAAQIAGLRVRNLGGEDAVPTSLASMQRILVAVSASPNSEYLLRWTRRLAFGTKTEWTCLYVESGAPISDADKDRLARHLTLARNLGARVVTMINDDVVSGVLAYARRNAASLLVVGKSGISERRLFRTRSSITDRLIRESGSISVVAVQERARQEGLATRVRRVLDKSRGRQYLLALLVVAVITVINEAISPVIGYTSASILYLASISLMGLFVARGPVLSAALLSALLWDFLFIPPRFTVFISRVDDVLMLFLYVLLAITSGWAGTRLKANSRIMEAREKRLDNLGELSSVLSGTRGIAEVARKGVHHVDKSFETSSFMFLKGGDGELDEGEAIGAAFALDEKDLSAARYCFDSGQVTGRFTGTLPGIPFQFVPMAAPGGTIGVIGMKLDDRGAPSEEQRAFVLTLVQNISIAVEREILAEKNRQVVLSAESERMADLLLNSVSHEIRTPLTVIKGSASALTDSALADNAVPRKELLDSILVATERLNDIVENLLSMSRLESGRLHLSKADTDVADLAAFALDHTFDELGNRKVRVAIPDECPPIFCDAALMGQVLSMLLQNVARYTRPGDAASLIVRVADDHFTFSVEDEGPGMSDEELSHLFEKFYRGRAAGNGGTGLGLSICKGIVEAHGGTIQAGKSDLGGLRVSFTLPRVAVQAAQR